MSTNNEDSILLARIDERTRSIVDDLIDLKHRMVCRNEFLPVKIIVFGMVGLIMTSVIGAIVAGVIVR